MQQKLFFRSALGLLFFLLLSPFAAPPLEASPAKKLKKIAAEPFPEFPKDGLWLNAKPFGAEFFKDKLTLVYFWDYTSINSIRELRAIKFWLQQYRPYGFQILWIHVPEFAIGSSPKNVQKALERLDMQGPVFLDNQFKLWESLKMKSWPAKYLVDENGKIIFSQIGEGRKAQLEEKVREALKQLDPGSVLPETLFVEDIDNYNPDLCGEMTGETYLGYKKATWWGAKIANEQWVPENGTLNFKDRGTRSDRGFFVEGLWTNREEFLEHARETGAVTDYLGLVYQGREVYAVLHQQEDKKGTRIYVTRDSQPVPQAYRGMDLEEDESGETYFSVQDPKLYYLIANEDEQAHELKLWTSVKGVAVHSFSFSNLCLADFDHR